MSIYIIVIIARCTELWSWGETVCQWSVVAYEVFICVDVNGFTYIWTAKVKLRPFGSCSAAVITESFLLLSARNVIRYELQILYEDEETWECDCVGWCRVLSYSYYTVQSDTAHEHWLTHYCLDSRVRMQLNLLFEGRVIQSCFFVECSCSFLFSFNDFIRFS